jgi:uncharacterized membrane protein YccF (DUF307 family)
MAQALPEYVCELLKLILIGIFLAETFLDAVLDELVAQILVPFAIENFPIDLHGF